MLKYSSKRAKNTSKRLKTTLHVPINMHNKCTSILFLFPSTYSYGYWKSGWIYMLRFFYERLEKEKKRIGRLGEIYGTRRILFGRMTASFPDDSCFSISSFIFIDDYRHQISIFSEMKLHSRTVFKFSCLISS